MESLRTPNTSPKPQWQRKSLRPCLAALTAISFLTHQRWAMAADAPDVSWPNAGKTASISGPFGGSSIAISISSRSAGAIDSLTWRGKQFVESSDHGRDYQSASFFRGNGLCLNPTEAGSNRDATGPTSTSRLLTLSVNGSTLRTKSLMAFWDDPTIGAAPCAKTTGIALSQDVLLKTVTIGTRGIPNAIEYTVTFRVPEARTNAGFEAVTGYMPPEFASFWTFDAAHTNLTPLSGVSSTAALKVSVPLIFSTEDQQYALGIYSPHGETHQSTAPIYIAYEFLDRAFKAVKWSCYFEEHDVSAGDHTFSCFMIVGSMKNVTRNLTEIRKSFQ